MNIKAVIFDLDGTLLDTIEDIEDSMNYVLSGRGFPVHDTGAYKYFVGDGVKNLVLRSLPKDATEETVKDVLDAYIERYSEHSADKTRPYDGVIDMLREFNRLAVPVSVLSNKPHTATLAVVAQYFDGIEFAAVLGARDGVPIKPDPAGALEIADTLGVRPGDILYLGDTATDMKTAVKAGMIPVGVLWGFRQREELEENGAKYIIDRPDKVFGLNT